MDGIDVEDTSFGIVLIQMELSAESNTCSVEDLTDALCVKVAITILLLIFELFSNIRI